MSDRKFFRTVLVIEVLTEGEPFAGDFEELASACVDGDSSGDIKVRVSEQVPGAQMARLLTEQHSDPGFLGLTESGEDDDEWRSINGPITCIFCGQVVELSPDGPHNDDSGYDCPNRWRLVDGEAEPQAHPHITTEPDADDLAFARDTLGADADGPDVYELAARRAAEAARDREND